MKRVSLVSISVILLVGCGESEKFDFVPVSGVITVDGVPMSGIRVQFSPQSLDGAMKTGGPSAAFTELEGHFVLRSIVGKGREGAVPGVHRVTFSARDPEDKPIVQEDGSIGYIDGEPPNLKLPVLSHKWTTQGIEFTVPLEGTEAANFELTTH
ncbi:hypothetical protein [Calycomorphotria hydatis]|uniref:Nickel uptake substrate-specific transmembrane region n=1 Tax=Calycomorphotria hydatis TaxID=2528027 RepID=A0A517T5B9_9PLAN|nr:hypothetical protein [Calycomorphotria hydatis]QDT63572.1 hypothetical protein V22_07960 [Calycomorphotria hydatis]